MANALEVSDQEAAAVAVAPRVALADIERAIAAEFYVTAGQAVVDSEHGRVAPDYEVPRVYEALDGFTICVIVLRNGWVITGTSAAASPENYNAELGRKIAYETAVKQIWPLMGFALRERLDREKHPADYGLTPPRAEGGA